MKPYLFKEFLGSRFKKLNANTPSRGGLEVERTTKFM